jgi:hypothetical protein
MDVWVCRTINEKEETAMSHIRKFVSVALALPVAFGVVDVWAQDNLNNHLTGTYAFTSKRTCTVAGLPFEGPDFLIPSGTFTFRQSASDSGYITFNGDGTASRASRSYAMNIANTAGGIVGVSEVTGDLTYTVNADGTVDTVSGPIVFEVILGSGVGTVGVVTGQIGRFQIVPGNLLISAPVDQITNETVVVTSPSGSSVTQHRICVRSTTARKVSKE